MSERRRALPPWMAKKEEKVNKKEPLKNRRKPKTTRSAFYCMNERELVEAAVSYLTTAAAEGALPLTGRQVKDVKTDGELTTSKMRAELELEALAEEWSTCSDDQDMTCVSKTDVDLTEVETLPYTDSPQHYGAESQKSRPGQDHSSLRSAEPKKKEEMPADAVEQEDDALRLVREIFFT